jgi:hypothetical protein
MDAVNEGPDHVEGAHETAHDAASTENDPAIEQAPAATEAQNAIVGDSGMFSQQPGRPPGGASSVDTPVSTSGPPAGWQQQPPLPEDQAKLAAEQAASQAAQEAEAERVAAEDAAKNPGA